MQINKTTFNTELQLTFQELELLSKSKNSLQEYLQDWKKTNIEEFIEFFNENLTLPIPDNKIELISYGIEVVANQGDLLRLKTALRINSTDDCFVCNYYAFFDLEGQLLDNYIDR